MPDIKNFGGQQIIEPGSYADIKGKVPIPAITASYSNVMLIDTGVGRGYGGGAGVKGTLELDGFKTVYQFTDPVEAKNFLRGGLLWSLVDFLFAPSNNGRGVSKLYIARAATTLPATAELDFGGSSPSDFGVIALQARAEGDCANGISNTNDSEILVQGHGFRLESGIYNTDAFVLKFLEGQFRGLDENGIPYDGIYPDDIVRNTVICKSKEFTTVNEFLAWANADPTFQKYFAIDLANTQGSDVPLTSDILVDFPDTVFFDGGVTEYASVRVDEVLDLIPDLDNSMFLALDYGPTPLVNFSFEDLLLGVNKGALAVENSKILTYIISNATDRHKMLIIGGNYSSANLVNGTDGSIDIAQFYNSPDVVVVHDKIRFPTITGTNGLGYNYLSTLFSAAMVCGRAAGVEPQINLTWKDIRMLGVYQELKKSERERALLAGVLHFRNVEGRGWVINQGVNTRQQNAAVVYADGTSPEISIMRIVYQLNREARLSLMAYVGGNLATVADVEIIEFMNGFLRDRCADTNNGKDGLIITFNSVKATLLNAAWNVTYCFVPNGPINQVFTTGFMLDPRLALNQ